jgi:hypothetical protein
VLPAALGVVWVLPVARTFSILLMMKALNREFVFARAFIARDIYTKIKP